MSYTERENYLRTAAFQGGEWIPCDIHISHASWTSLREDLEQVAARHPTIFPGFEKGRHDYANWEFGPAHRSGERFTDAWGCVWDNIWGGLEGQVIEHPLADWSALATYQVPDPMTTADRGPADWPGSRRYIDEARAAGHLTSGGLPHGFLLMRLWYLRGFDNLMADLVEEPEELSTLIEMLTTHNLRIVREWLDIGVDLVSFGEDLGTQRASTISPATFRKWIAPAYRRLMQPCRDAGAHVYLHSDGHILELVDDLIQCGVTILNPQDLCNGIDNLAREMKGRVCISLDVDRQKIVPFGTRKEIRELVREEVMKLGSPQGGFMFAGGIYPPTPPENVDALCSALEEFRTYWWDGRG
jgi:uroporphyrinogen decarboxylase